MDVVVDDLDIPNERLAWLEAAEDLKKPVYLRTELEVSRLLTLMSRLRFMQGLNFQERFALTKVATFRYANTGEVLLTAHGNTSLLGSGGSVNNNNTATSPAAVAGRGAVPAVSLDSTKGAFTLTSRLTTTTTFDDVLDENIPKPDSVSIIVFGSVGLRVETVNGRVQSLYGKGDAIGNPLVEEALPPGSQFVALEPVELLVFTTAQFEELLVRVDAFELRSRVQFFRSLVVPILQPWSDSELEELAKACYPMRLQSKELVVKEGSPADAMYFILSGKLKVVREVDFSVHNSSNTTAMNIGSCSMSNGGQTPLHNTHHSSNAVAAGGGGGSNNAVSLVKLLELATLQEGEYFGELALIRYLVDDNRRTNLMKLLSSNDGNSATLNGSRGAYTSKRKSVTLNSLGGGATMSATESVLELLSDPSGGDIDSDEELKELSEERPALVRQATVYAHTPATVLVLPRRCFIQLFRGPALVRVREYAKGYPSQQDIRNHFQRQQKWESFKTELVAQVRGTDQRKVVTGGSSSIAGGGGGAGSGGASPRQHNNNASTSRRNVSQSPRTHR